ncbi:MAG: DUF4012 domain-containing protein [Actinobacteria bacterium]|nr:DUF4012 domain-containing protein [Actinomycetota bacterium]
MSLKKRVLLAALLGTALVAALGLYVAVPVSRDLSSVRALLTRSPERLSGPALEDARERLVHADQRLSSPAALVLGLVPGVRQNLQAVRAVTTAALPVVEAGSDLGSALHSAERTGLLDAGAVRLDTLTRLRAPVDRQAEALSALRSQIQSHRNGWLLPFLWSDFDSLLDRVTYLSRGADIASQTLEIAGPMLGVNDDRTYLVLLLNNSELRGAGGILSGVGTISARSGKLSLGDFSHYKDLGDDPPYRSVPAPDDFTRHFQRYNADTTRWVATSSSPDIPDVALVARNLYELVRGVKADGVIVADPRGLASLLPRSARVTVPTTGTKLSARQIPPYAYAREYQELSGGQTRRREALIDVGDEAFRELLDRGVPDLSILERAAGALAGGHLRVLSFRPDERRVLEAAGVTGELGQPPFDGALSTVQNFGGNKLDYYARRSIIHRCEVAGGSDTRCETAVTIDNRTPLGLTDYQYQYRPLGLFKNFVEVYIPARAELQAVEVDGRAARFFSYPEDGYRALGVYLEIPRGSATTMSVAYTLPADSGGYSLAITPQALSNDARVKVRLSFPEGWVARGPGGSSRQSYSYEGTLNRILRVEAGPDERTGLPAFWENASRFLREPLF